MKAMATKLIFQNGHEVVVIESHQQVDVGLSSAYGTGFVHLRRDLGSSGESALTVNPTTVAYFEGIPELTQIGNVFG
jgi:hypothetical protein